MTDSKAPENSSNVALLATLPPIAEMLTTMAGQLDEILRGRQRSDPLFIGIHTGGVWLAHELIRILQISSAVSELDVSLYRDDYSSKGLKPGIRATSLPDSMAGRHIVLVDDVIMTGRTIRGAINQLFDYGRPASILLVELIDLPARELPLQADVVGHRMDSMPHRRIKLAGPTPLRLELVDWAKERG